MNKFISDRRTEMIKIKSNHVHHHMTTCVAHVLFGSRFSWFWIWTENILVYILKSVTKKNWGYFDHVRPHCFHAASLTYRAPRHKSMAKGGFTWHGGMVPGKVGTLPCTNSGINSSPQKSENFCVSNPQLQPRSPRAMDSIVRRLGVMKYVSFALFQNLVKKVLDSFQISSTANILN